VISVSRSSEAWLGAALLTSLAVFVWIASIELGSYEDRVLHVDEWYFASCAARGSATGEFPIASCHDNKAPLIYWLYQIVHLGKPHYDLPAIKGAAFVTVGLIGVLAAALGYRLGGLPAGIVAPLLISLSMGRDASFLALKTETVGSVFVLGLALMASSPQFREGRLRLFAAGFVAGLAVLTKQTFAFVALALMIWLLLVSRDRGLARWQDWARNSSVFGIGVLTPFLLSLAFFSLQGRGLDFLASFFLYPSVYGAAGADFFSRQLLWSALAVLDVLAEYPLVTALACGSIGLTLVIAPKWAERTDGSMSLLLLLVALAHVTVLGLSPKFFDYHIIPLLVVMAVLGSWFVARCMAALAAQAHGTEAAMAWVLLSAALLNAAHAIRHEGGRLSRTHYSSDPARIEGSEGRYGYALAMWPQFYVANGIIPASNVQFPWALPGTPSSWAFVLPARGSRTARMLEKIQQANLRTLMSDFERTPPSHILVAPRYAGGDQATGMTGVPQLNEYIRKNCLYSHSIQGQSLGPGVIFNCLGASR